MLKTLSIVLVPLVFILSPCADACAATPLGGLVCIMGTDTDVDLMAFPGPKTRLDCGPDRFSGEMQRM
ncbi:MAG: hypothetical protein WA979_07810 [Pacificimonas sp.]